MSDKHFCGPEILPEAVEKALSPNRLNEACKQHDADYSEGKVTRKEADSRFYKAMMAGAKTVGEKLLAVIYYRFVHRFGGLFYRRRK